MPRKLAVLMECDCAKLMHDHGALEMYRKHKCRCALCTEAKHAQYLRLSDKEPRVDARPVVRRVRELVKMGFNNEVISKASGVSLGTLGRICNSKKRDIAVNRATSDLILGLTHTKLVAAMNTMSTMKVDVVMAQRQLQELIALGWTVETMSLHTRLASNTLNRILTTARSTVQGAVDVEALYLKLRNVEPPVETELDRKRRQRALKKAEKNSWDAVMTERLEDMAWAS